MARLDWDRLRRVRPLDGADARVDPDGGVVWERAATDEPLAVPGARRLRRGVIVRRRQEREANVAPSASVTPDKVRCPRCGVQVAKRKLLRHARRCPRAESRE